MLRKTSSRGESALVISLKEAAPVFRIEPIAPLFAGQNAQLLLDPTAADGLGSAVAILRKAKDWASVRISSTLLKKIESVAPDILFDIEKKLVFTSNVVNYSAAFYDWFANAAAGLKSAYESGDEAQIAKANEIFVNGVLTYLHRIGVYYHDFNSFFGMEVYNQFRASLNTLKINDRRAIEAFYSRFQVAVASMGRMYEREMPRLAAHNAITLEHVMGWVSDLAQCIDRLYESAVSLLEA